MLSRGNVFSSLLPHKSINSSIDSDVGPLDVDRTYEQHSDIALSNVRATDALCGFNEISYFHVNLG